MYSMRKNFIFHEKKVVEFITQQPNQSKYIESLVFKDMLSEEVTDIFEFIRKQKQHFEQHKPIESNNNFSNSISNILNF